MAARNVLSRALNAPLRSAMRPQLVSTPMLRVLPSVSLSQQRNYSDAAHGLAREEVKHRILDILHTFDKADRNKVNENAHFVSDLGLDSLDVVEVVMAVEEEFAIEIPDEAADRIMSVPDAINYVASQPEAI